VRLTLFCLLALAEPSGRGSDSSAPTLYRHWRLGLALCATTSQPRRRQL